MSEQSRGESRKPRQKSDSTPRSNDQKPKRRRPKKDGETRAGSDRNAATSASADKRGDGTAAGDRKPAKRRGPKPASASGSNRGEKRTGSDKPRKKKDFRKGSPAKAKARTRKASFDSTPRITKAKKTIVPDGATVPFASMNLAEPVANAIAEAGYVCATPIQAEAIPPALEGRDILGCAQTGTGKTAAFALPILSKIAANPGKSVPHKPRVLMLAPTRELAAQILDSITEYGRNLRLRSAVIFGGVGQGRQVAALQRGVHILVATPGRLIDLMDQGYIDLSALETFVLDEADRMLDMGFLPALNRIISELPDKRQSLFFSATVSREIKKLTETLLRDPVAIDVTPPERTVDLIAQTVQFVKKRDKPERLLEVLTADDVGQSVVFTRTKRGANDVAERLEKAGMKAEAIHGNKSQNARTKTLNAFRVGRVQVLVATDVAARGLDIDDVTHVINYELPNEPESYVHRIGRTGRAGAKGQAIAFCDANEKDFLRDIQKLIDQKIPVVGDDDVGYERPEPQGNRRAAVRGGNRGGANRSSSNRNSSQGRGGSSDRRPASRRRENDRSSTSESRGKRTSGGSRKPAKGKQRRTND